METQNPENAISAQENVHRVITEWKKRRAEDEQEAAERLNSPAYQEIFKKLAEKNEERRNFVPGR